MLLLSREFSLCLLQGGWEGLIEVWCRGVYVPNDDRWPAHFRGMGIRIEDSICVGEEHPIVLSAEAAKEVSL